MVKNTVVMRFVFFVSLILCSSLWSEARFYRMGNIPGAIPDFMQSQAFGISGDGNVIVGQAYEVPGNQSFGYAVIWSVDEGIQELGYFCNRQHSEAKTCNFNGAIIAGNSVSSSSGSTPFIWNNGQATCLLDSAGYYVTGISADGTILLSDKGFWQSETGWELIGHCSDISQNNSVIVGYAMFGGNNYASRWTESEGIKPLGHLGGNKSRANAISANGQVVVGYSQKTEIWPGPGEAFYLGKWYYDGAG